VRGPTVSDPHNLPRIMPPRLGARLVRVERVPPPGSPPGGDEARSRDGRDGTVVRDVLEYEVGMGALGELAERLLVGRQMARTFEHRQRTLEALLASS
jgi:hypothetical protein